MVWVGLVLAYLAFGFLMTMGAGLLWPSLNKGGPGPPIILTLWPVVLLIGFFVLAVGGLSYLAVECAERIRRKAGE